MLFYTSCHRKRSDQDDISGGKFTLWSIFHIPFTDFNLSCCGICLTSLVSHYHHCCAVTFHQASMRQNSSSPLLRNELTIPSRRHLGPASILTIDESIITILSNVGLGGSQIQINTYRRKSNSPSSIFHRRSVLRYHLMPRYFQGSQNCHFESSFKREEPVTLVVSNIPKSLSWYRVQVKGFKSSSASMVSGADVEVRS